ncbi:MAG: hypothetical protein WCK98_04785 [bacterium]
MPFGIGSNNGSKENNTVQIEQMPSTINAAFDSLDTLSSLSLRQSGLIIAGDATRTTELDQLIQEQADEFGITEPIARIKSARFTFADFQSKGAGFQPENLKLAVFNTLMHQIFILNYQESNLQDVVGRGARESRVNKLRGEVQKSIKQITQSFAAIEYLMTNCFVEKKDRKFGASKAMLGGGLSDSDSESMFEDASDALDSIFSPLISQNQNSLAYYLKDLSHHLNIYQTYSENTGRILGFGGGSKKVPDYQSAVGYRESEVPNYSGYQQKFVQGSIGERSQSNQNRRPFTPSGAADNSRQRDRSSQSSDRPGGSRRLTF